MFKEAYKITMKNEGGYSNHPDDHGGETYKGIARNYHSGWSGWKIIDNNSDFKTLPELQILVEQFYKKKYWDSISLSTISDIYNNVANELFDIAVNFGKKRSSKTIQRAINILNRDERNYSDISVDGYIGKKTIQSLIKYSKNNNEDLLLKLIILLKAKYYIDIVESNSSQEIFIRGWINRIGLKL